MYLKEAYKEIQNNNNVVNRDERYILSKNLYILRGCIGEQLMGCDNFLQRKRLNELRSDIKCLADQEKIIKSDVADLVLDNWSLVQNYKCLISILDNLC